MSFEQILSIPSWFWLWVIGIGLVCALFGAVLARWLEGVYGGDDWGPGGPGEW